MSRPGRAAHEGWLPRLGAVALVAVVVVVVLSTYATASSVFPGEGKAA
jgi:hypothetical protein